MSGVIGGVDILLSTSSNLSTEQCEVLDLIRTSGETCVSQLNDILDLSKIEAGRVELENRVFSLRHCIEACLDVLSDKATKKGLDLFYECCNDDVVKYSTDDADDTETRPLLVPNLIVADESRLKQVLLNLLGQSTNMSLQIKFGCAIACVA
jgi:two-component system, sensor histidine kinase